MSAKTGAEGRPWVQLDNASKPPAVADVYAYWQQEPPEFSPRARWWVRQIAAGWRLNRRYRQECDECLASMLGVWVWEVRGLIVPAIEFGRTHEPLTD